MTEPKDTKNAPPLDMGGPVFTSWREKAFDLARENLALEEAVTWYLGQTKVRVDDPLDLHWEGDDAKHARLLRRYRKDFDENRDDN